jgi:hypothetical protein
MSEPAQRTSDVTNALMAFCLPLMLLALGSPAAFTQCSQAARPALVSSAQSAASAQSSSPPVISSESSSSSQTAREVRFVTSSAITVLEETPLQVITNVPISSRTTKAGAQLPFTVTRDVVVDGILVIPCGARVYGTVVSAKQAGRLVGASNLTLQLTALNLDGRSYPLYTPPFKVVGQSKTRPTVNKVATGAAVGAAAMDAAMDIGIATSNPTPPPIQTGDRAKADAVVAGMGAGVGIAIAASSPPSIAVIPAESQMEFTLAAPIAVYPVDQRTAMRLAQGMLHGGPVLYIRGENQ